MSVSCPTETREAIGVYASSNIEGASPEQLVLITYDFVIGSCRRGEAFKAKDGVVELMSALNLDYADVSGPLFRIYEYLLDIIREEKFEEAIGILTELRKGWKEAMQNAGPETVNQEF